MVAGVSRDDEIVFRWANELNENNTVQSVTTVNVGNRNTEAGFTITQGVTGTSIFTVLLRYECSINGL
jgi:trehalose 6-phosphate synthase complex regulatory subunit